LIEHYRQFVIKALPKLIKLDNKTIESAERENLQIYDLALLNSDQPPEVPSSNLKQEKMQESDEVKAELLKLNEKIAG